jgi:hypothetical protein
MDTLGSTFVHFYRFSRVLLLTLVVAIVLKPCHRLAKVS